MHIVTFVYTIGISSGKNFPLYTFDSDYSDPLLSRHYLMKQSSPGKQGLTVLQWVGAMRSSDRDIHARNFVVKCRGTAWCETNILLNLKRKMWEDGILYYRCLKKWRGRVPHVPHLISPMEILMKQTLRKDGEVHTAIIRQSGWKIQISKVKYRSTLRK